MKQVDRNIQIQIQIQIQITGEKTIRNEIFHVIIRLDLGAQPIVEGSFPQRTPELQAFARIIPHANVQHGELSVKLGESCHPGWQSQLHDAARYKGIDCQTVY